MGDPVTLTFASAGLSLFSGVMQGAAARDAAQFERQQYEDRRQTALIAADQEEAQRRRELQQTLAAQDAIRSARGLDLYSGTGQAIREDTIAQGERDIATARLNRMSEARQYGLAADQAGSKAGSALFGGFLSGAASAAGTLAKLPRSGDKKE